jgi:hypothetical protein
VGTFIFEQVRLITTSIDFFLSKASWRHFHIFNDDDDNNECEPVEHLVKDSTDEDDQSDGPGCNSDDEFSDQEIDETESDDEHEEETTEIKNYSEPPDEATRTTILK